VGGGSAKSDKRTPAADVDVIPDPIEAFVSSAPPNDPKYKAEWKRWHNLLYGHYSQPKRLRTEGDGSTFVDYEAWLGEDGIHPVRCIDPQTGVGTWVSDNWRALPTCWARHPDAVARRLADGMACSIWHRLYGERVDLDHCAGCRTPMISQPFGLPDGTVVHVDPDFECLKLYGRRWRQTAADALAKLGIIVDGDPEAPDAPSGLDVPY
jgi:hypothetical protein